MGGVRTRTASTRAQIADLELTDDERALRDLMRDFARGAVAPHAARWWDDEQFPVELFQRMGELDLMGLLVPESHGGTDVTMTALVAALFELAKVDQSIAAAWQCHLTIGSIPLIKFGSEAQKERWLRPLASGEQLGSFALTEPEAGSDAGAIRTLAERAPDGTWTLTGTKTFISNAGTPMSLGPVVLARMPPNGNARNFVSILVPTGAVGYTAGPKLRGIGWHALDSRELSFDAVALGDDHVIGKPGRGLAQFLETLDIGRITIATLGIALAEAVLELSLDHAKQRMQFGRPISKFQGIQFKLADIAAQLEAVKLLVYRCARLYDLGLPHAKESAMAKLLASELAMKAASEAVQVHGGYGFMHDSPVARYFCDAKILEIGEGTNEIQRIVIARHLGC